MSQVYDEKVVAEYRKQMNHCDDFKGRFVPNGYLYAAGGFPQSLEEFEPRDDDIFLIAYPKSGTTWMADVLSLLLNQGDEKILEKGVFDRVIMLEGFKDQGALYRKALSKLNLKTLFVTAGIGVVKQFRRDTNSGRRIIFSHAIPEWLPKETQEGKHKIIYVTRNPKDIIVSYHYFHKVFLPFSSNFNMNWDDFFKIFASEQCVYGSWFEHVKSYYKLSQKNPNLLFVKYEDLKKDLPAKIGEIGKFLEEEVDDSLCHKIAELTQFKSMVEKRRKVNSEYARLFTRKGVVGDWKNNFTVAQNEIFDEIYAEKMADVPLNYEFEAKKK